MWGLYNQAKTWKCRPSDLVGIEEVYRAYCFDEAVATWGTFIVGELEKIEGKNEKEVTRKRQSKLLQLIDAPAEKRFRAMRKPPMADKVVKKKR